MTGRVTPAVERARRCRSNSNLMHEGRAIVEIGAINRMAMRQLSAVIPEVLYLHTGIDFTRPTEIRASLTERCNYKCLQCACWRFERMREMSIDQWKTALASLR